MGSIEDRDDCKLKPYTLSASKKSIMYWKRDSLLQTAFTIYISILIKLVVFSVYVQLFKQCAIGKDAKRF